MADLTQRLNQYQKRLARHTQIKIARDHAGLPVSRRTLAAIENNAKWVDHFQQLIIFEHTETIKRPESREKEELPTIAHLSKAHIGEMISSLKADAKREKGKVVNPPDHLQRASVEVSRN